ncbi:MAG: hypothetical protein PW734_12760 [Verrucomicrobium sp.]|nr:hypothetical protein [Verrucomicrobium sp.]
MSDPRPPSTLLLAFSWFLLGPGLLMPLFFLAPGFIHSDGGWGDRLRIGGSIGYFVLAAAVLIPVTRRYYKQGQGGL